MRDLIALNNLSRHGDGVFGPADAPAQAFGYSDGEETERYLHRVLSEASDLSSRSAELQAKIRDWPSEYHLSSDRSNILRGFDLGGVKRVLELGSGCGAISRYLGEQGIAVDAIEGSAVRARLGRLRCRDLENVRVVAANYNDLEIPGDHYDLVLFIGVVEYARRFRPDAESDRQAAIEVLAQARDALVTDGAVIVAIENRLGLKYAMGCHEDHYARRYIGIHGYPDSAGIATYSDREWRDLIAASGFAHSAFTYAFPDYKIPRVLLGEDYARDNRNAFNHLEGLAARDYVAPVESTPTEPVFWQAASAGGFLDTLANSFCILLSDSGDRLARTAPFDFCHLPGPGRKNEFAVVTSKPRGADVVHKQPVSPATNRSGELRQVLDEQPYLPGQLLSAHWLRTVLIYVRREEFERELERYMAFLKTLEDDGQPLSIDMLPINIIVDDRGRLSLFDQEWEVDWPLDRPYLLFRALLTFIVANWRLMEDFLRWLDLHTVQDFIDYGFRTCGLHLAPWEENYIELENRFHEIVSAQPGGRDVRALLATAFDFTSAQQQVYPTCYFTGDGAPFDEDRKVSLQILPDPEVRTLEFPLPAMTGPVDRLRIHPFDMRRGEQVGFYRFDRLAVVEYRDDQSHVLWQLEGEAAIAAHCVAEGTVFTAADEGGTWMARGDFPAMTFDLGSSVGGDTSTRLAVLADLRIAENPLYRLARLRFAAREQELERKLVGAEESMAYLRELEHTLAMTRKELAHIKAGKPFRLGMKIVNAAALLKGGKRQPEEGSQS